MTLSLKQSFETFSDFKAQLYQWAVADNFVIKIVKSNYSRFVVPPVTQVLGEDQQKKPERRRIGGHQSSTLTLGKEIASRAPPRYSTSHKVGHYPRTCR